MTEINAEINEIINREFVLLKVKINIKPLSNLTKRKREKAQNNKTRLKRETL